MNVYHIKQSCIKIMQTNYFPVSDYGEWLRLFRLNQLPIDQPSHVGRHDFGISRERESVRASLDRRQLHYRLDTSVLQFLLL